MSWTIWNRCWMNITRSIKKLNWFLLSSIYNIFQPSLAWWLPMTFAYFAKGGGSTNLLMLLSLLYHHNPIRIPMMLWYPILPPCLLLKSCYIRCQISFRVCQMGFQNGEKPTDSRRSELECPPSFAEVHRKGVGPWLEILGGSVGWDSWIWLGINLDIQKDTSSTRTRRKLP